MDLKSPAFCYQSTALLTHHEWVSFCYQNFISWLFSNAEQLIFRVGMQRGYNTSVYKNWEPSGELRDFSSSFFLEGEMAAAEKEALEPSRSDLWIHKTEKATRWGAVISFATCGLSRLIAIDPACPLELQLTKLIDGQKKAFRKRRMMAWVQWRKALTKKRRGGEMRKTIEEEQCSSEMRM